MNENEKLKTDISYLEKKLDDYEKEIDYCKNEKDNADEEIKKLQNDIENNMKEIESLNHLIEQYKEEISNLNAELDQYENESKTMDNEIRTLKNKIIELNNIIEELRKQIAEYESHLPPEKSINEQFCDLFKDFSKKKIIPHEIDMIVGMHLAKQEIKNQKKYDNLLEVQDRLKKRITDLTGQLNNYKDGKILGDLEDHKIEFEINSNRSNRTQDFCNKSQIIEDDSRVHSYRNYLNDDKGTRGIKTLVNNNSMSRIIDMGTTTKQVGNTIITTKTTQISYKRKRGGNNQ